MRDWKRQGGSLDSLSEKALCFAGGLAGVSMRSATARTDDLSPGLEPDESFLIGERAARFLRIEASDGSEAALDELGEPPPDLAAQVEYTSTTPGRSRSTGTLEFQNCGNWPPAPSGVRPGFSIFKRKGAQVGSRFPASCRACARRNRPPQLPNNGGSKGWLHLCMLRVGRGKPVVLNLLTAAGMRV